MAEVIRKLEKSLGIKSSDMNKLMKTNDEWWKGEYKPPVKYTSFKGRRDVVNKVPDKTVAVAEDNSIAYVDNEDYSLDDEELIDVNTMASAVNYLISISKHSKNTRAKVEARQALDYLKRNIKDDKVTPAVYNAIHKAVDYLKGYFGLGG